MKKKTQGLRPKEAARRKKPQKMVKSVTTNILDKGSPIPGGDGALSLARIMTWIHNGGTKVSLQRT
ncbi:Uncharacterized protein APZ42_032391 [Daphnia magna]|uniref:Uncharacterized protein n=1 Tax=Daphnia magna TaxID=35525 RepID=A0A164M1B0_9CRUS|nr:Uncharacterized protein APZ42_032391 [Daphnia magna]